MTTIDAASTTSLGAKQPSCQTGRARREKNKRNKYGINQERKFLLHALI
jgi:hypothetical protein